MTNICAVVIPIYKTFDVDEVMCINQMMKMTHGFKKFFVAPQSFSLDSSYSNFEDVEIIRFDDCFFQDIQSYNRLMLNTAFYEAFLDYEYILIHQTDAYLFKDELTYWCNQNYDYLGAPWYTPKRLSRYSWFKFAFKYLGAFFSKQELVRRRSYNCVGNGGLSLRKINTFIKVLASAPEKLLQLYLEDTDRFFNEDVFWSIEAPEILAEYNVPKYEVGMHFALESESEKLYKLMSNKLPFGCHGFKKADPSFWKQFIPYKLNEK